MKSLKTFHAIGEHNGEKIILNFWSFSIMKAREHIKNRFGSINNFTIAKGWIGANG